MYPAPPVIRIFIRITSNESAAAFATK